MPDVRAQPHRAHTRYTDSIANVCLQVKRTVKLVTEQRIMYIIA